MSTTVQNSTLKVTISAKVGISYLMENTFSVANINEVTDRELTVPTDETDIILFSTSAGAGTYVKSNLKFACIANKDDTNYVRLRLKKVTTNRITTLGSIVTSPLSSGYPNGTYTNVPLTGGTGTGATATIVALGTAIFTVGTITGGTGYVNGTYTNVPLTGGSGSGAQATIIVGGSPGTQVITVTITAKGSGYAVGNVLSASNTNLGGSGSGFAVPVASLCGPITSVTLVEPGTGYTIGDSLSASNTDLGGAGSGFLIPVSLTETVAGIFDHKLEAGRFFVICNTTISTDSLNGNFISFVDIDRISAEADTAPVDIQLYLALT